MEFVAEFGSEFGSEFGLEFEEEFGREGVETPQSLDRSILLPEGVMK